LLPLLTYLTSGNFKVWSKKRIQPPSRKHQLNNNHRITLNVSQLGRGNRGL
jgi:hypothetical protein